MKGARLIVNDILRLSLHRGEVKVEIDATVLRATEEHLLVCPTSVPLPHDLRAGAEVELRFWSADGLHHARTAVLAVAEAPPHLLTLAPPQAFETAQARRFVRVFAPFPVRFTVATAALKEVQKAREQSVVTQDVSPGGLRFLTTLPLVLKDLLDVKVTLHGAGGVADAETFQSKLLVIRTALIRKGRSERVEIAGEFLKMSDQTRDQIAAFLSQYQK